MYTASMAKHTSPAPLLPLSRRTAPVNSPGVWHVLAYLNGTALFDLPFTISPVQLTNYMLTKSVNTSNCNTPAPATTFSSTDRAAYLWFSVAGANAGDIASANWIAPAGSTYATSTWSPLSSGGAYYWGPPY